MYALCEYCQNKCKDAVEKFEIKETKRTKTTKCPDFKNITEKWLAEEKIKEENRKEFQKNLDKARNK
jgi:hypothetical protein